jgi:hypothetical protein
MTSPANTSSTNTSSSGSAPAPIRIAAELCVVAELSDGAQGVLADAGGDLPPKAFVTTLVERELFADAVRFLAHALPRREAVWWAWVCARKNAGVDPAPKTRAALDATERWIMQPTEDNRRQAMTFGEAAEFATAAGAAALSAFMSSGSLAPPDAPLVPPGEFMTAKAVTGSVTLAAVTPDAALAPEKFREYVRLGLEVADRTKLWVPS